MCGLQRPASDTASLSSRRTLISQTSRRFRFKGSKGPLANGLTRGDRLAPVRWLDCIKQGRWSLMAPRPPRRRRSKRQSNARATNGSAATLLSQVSELVAENQSLVRENKELHLIVARVSQALKGVASRPATQDRANASPSRRTESPRRERGRITDPATLQHRRARVAQARHVLAGKRAASKDQ